MTIDEVGLEKITRETFGYFLHEINPDNGLVKDKSAPDWPSSIAATGMALAIYPVAVEHGFITRGTAMERVLTTLRFFWNSQQGPEPDATGYHGFYYHFLDMQTGRRVWQCELSTVDSAILFAGILTVGVYFDAIVSGEQEISITDFSKNIYVCGPPPMMDAVEKILSDLHVDENLIIKEAF